MSQRIDSFSDFGRAFDFVYPLEPSDKKKATKLHAVRDASPAMQVLPTVLEQGFLYAGPIFNRAPRGPLRRRVGLKGHERPPIVHVDYSFLRSKDLLIQACRPPIDDDRSGCKKYVPRSYTDLEQLLFEALKPYFFEYCARDRVCVASQFHPLLHGDLANRREMIFHQNGNGAIYLELNAFDWRGSRKAEVGNRTALFLLRLEEAWPGGPGYLCFFGQDGLASYIWSFRLANDFNFLLKRPGFAMAELEVQELPKGFPLTMDWCLDWKIELLFAHEFGDSARVRRSANG
jgi:hypothetical protein